MADMETVKVVVSGISALGSLIKLWRDFRAQKPGVTPQQLETAGTLVRYEIPQGELQALARVIPQEILDVIDGNVQKARERLKKALGDPSNTQQAKDQEVEVAASTVCAELGRLKRLNGGELPDGLQNDWLSFGCA